MVDGSQTRSCLSVPALTIAKPVRDRAPQWTRDFAGSDWRVETGRAAQDLPLFFFFFCSFVRALESSQDEWKKTCVGGESGVDAALTPSHHITRRILFINISPNLK